MLETFYRITGGQKKLQCTSNEGYDFRISVTFDIEPMRLQSTMNISKCGINKNKK